MFVLTSRAALLLSFSNAVVSNHYSKPFLWHIVSSLYSILHNLLLRFPYVSGVWVFVASHFLLFLLAFLLLIHLLILLLFPCSVTVCQQYLLLFLLLLYARVLIIKSYNQLLQIFHLLSREFSQFLQFNCITYCQSQVLFTTLDILFEPCSFSAFPNLTDFIPEGHAERKKEFDRYYVFFHFLSWKQNLLPYTYSFLCNGSLLLCLIFSSFWPSAHNTDVSLLS